MNIPRRSAATHPTGGLPGYPARDHFAPPGERVCLLDRGYVYRLSGRSPSTGGRPGGSYGWSIYVQADDGSRWFLTHFASRRVRLGQRIGPTTVLGTVQNCAVAGMDRSLSHIHAGRRPPGGRADVALLGSVPGQHYDPDDADSRLDPRMHTLALEALDASDMPESI